MQSKMQQSDLTPVLHSVVFLSGFSGFLCRNNAGQALGDDCVRPLMLMLRMDTRDRGGTVIAISEAPEGMPAGPPADQGH